MQFRTATHSDVPELNRLVNSAYRGDSSRAGWTTEADLLEGVRTNPENLLSDIENPDSRIELLFDSNQVLQGCVCLRKKPNGICYLGTLSVNPLLQGKGCGKLILDHSEKVAKEWNCNQISMSVISRRHELIAYYERRGYRLTGNTEPFPVEPELFQWKVENLVLAELIKKL